PGGSGIITGSFTVEESTNLAVLLRAGALPAGLTFLEERTIGPELGQDSIDAGRNAAYAAMVAVFIFMVASYGAFGLVAVIALAVNIVLIFALLSLVGATLRIPYSFLVPIFGGRNWTIISAGLLLIPAIAMAICLGNPETPFPVLLLVAALAGFGGGNFASSMSNITYFY
ncbi:hypothetical protein D7Y13_42235, partial [Corallococcus praedator]